jgi:gas vesicle protein
MRQNKLLWFLTGVGMGALAGLALAPQAGTETRRRIRGFVSARGHEYMEYGRDLYEQGRHLADEAGEMFEEGRRLMEVTESGEADA